MKRLCFVVVSFLAFSHFVNARVPSVVSDSVLLHDEITGGISLSESGKQKSEAMARFARAFLDVRISGKMTDAAEADLFSAIESDPDSDDPYVMLLAPWNKNKDYERYLEFFLPLLEKKKESIKLALVSYSLLLQTKRDEEAIALLEKCYKNVVSVNKKPNDIPHFESLIATICNSYKKSNDFVKGDELLSEINTSTIGHAMTVIPFYSYAAGFVSGKNKFLIFRSDRELFMKKADDSVRWLQLELAGRYQEVRKLSDVVQLLAGCGYGDEAEDVVKKNIALVDDDLDSLLLLANFYETQKRSNEAYDVWLKITQKSLRLQSKYYTQLMRSALNKGEVEYVIDSLNKHLELNPGDDDSWFQLGCVYLDQKQYTLAVSCLKRVNKNLYAKYLVGVAHLSLGNYSESLRSLVDYRRLINDDRRLSRYYYFTLSQVYDKTESQAELLACLDVLLARFGDSHEVKNFVGYSLADNNLKLEEAKVLIEAALEANECLAYMDSYVWVLYKLDRIEDAIDEIDFIVNQKMEVTDGVIYVHFGDVYNVYGDSEKALGFWRKALEVSSMEVDLEKVKEKIKNLEARQ